MMLPETQRGLLNVASALLFGLAACSDQPTGNREASWPPIPAHFVLQSIDGNALPTATGPDASLRLVDSARFDFDLASGVYAWTLTPFVEGRPWTYLHSLTTVRVAADSFVGGGGYPGAPSPDLFLAVRDSTLILYWRPPQGTVSIASFIVGQRNEDWHFRAR